MFDILNQGSKNNCRSNITISRGS